MTCYVLEESAIVQSQSNSEARAKLKIVYVYRRCEAAELRLAESEESCKRAEVGTSELLYSLFELLTSLEASPGVSLVTI